MPTPPRLPIGAILPKEDEGADDLLRALAQTLTQQGWRVRGVVQAKALGHAGSCDLSLVDLSDGDIYPISQYLGSASTSCCLDLGGLVEASAVLRRITPANTDLAIVSRFAGLEASGQGFAAELLQLMGDGIPVLTVVHAKHLDAWRHFTGDSAHLLPPEAEALEDWARGILHASLAA